MPKRKSPNPISDYLSLIGSRGGSSKSAAKVNASKAAMERINAAKRAEKELRKDS